MLTLSRNCFLERINSLQCYELTTRCSPLRLMLASPLTFAVNPWSVHCNCAVKKNCWRLLKYFHFPDTSPNQLLTLSVWSICGKRTHRHYQKSADTAPQWKQRRCFLLPGKTQYFSKEDGRVFHELGTILEYQYCYLCFGCHSKLTKPKNSIPTNI